MPDRRGKGGNLSRKGVGLMRTGSDTRCSSKHRMKGNKIPVKPNGTMLIKEEMSKKSTHQNSPNVVARLMGLDFLPTPQPMKNDSDIAIQEPSLTVHKHAYYKDQSSMLNSKNQEEFKDVFEVTDASEIERSKNQHIENILPKYRRSAKETFTNKSFLDLRCLSTEEMLECSEDCSDGFDFSDVNMDNSLLVHQEPNSVSMRLAEDLHSVPFDPQPRNNKVLESLDVQKKEINENLRTKRDDKKHTIKMPSQFGNVLQQSECDPINHSINEHFASPCTFDKIKLESNEQCPVPTRIVVLKPGLNKVKEDKRTMTSSNKFQPCNRRKKDHLSLQSHKPMEVRDERFFSDEVEVERLKNNWEKERTSRERKSSKMQNVIGRFNILSHTDNGIGLSRRSRRYGNENLMINAGVKRCDPRNSDDRSSYHKLSSFHLAESSVNGNKKHHSEYWRSSKSSKTAGEFHQGLNTLGEMLAFSDREANDPPLTEKMHFRQGIPSGISSRDGWKNIYPRKLTRSNSLPPSQSVSRNPKPSNLTGSLGSEDCFTLKDMLNLTSVKSPERNTNKNLTTFGPTPEVANKRYLISDPGEEESEHSVWAANLNPIEQKNGSHISENSPVHHHSTVRFYDAEAYVDELPSEIESPSELLDDPQLMPITVESSSDDNSITNHTDIISKGPSLDKSLESSFSREVMDLPTTSCYAECSNSFSAASFAESCFPSLPDPPVKEESNDSCFERVNADLQALRLQLQLLKQQSTNKCEEVSDVPSVKNSTRELQKSFSGEDDRDFSYLADMLNLSGLRGSFLDSNSAMHHLKESPVGPDIFEKLEKGYGGLGWSRAERTLLFDVTNTNLLKLFVPDGVLYPWVKPAKSFEIAQGRKVTAENMWKLFIEQRMHRTECNTLEEMLFTNCMGKMDDVDVIGQEIEMCLTDELLDDFVSDLCFQGASQVSKI